VTSVTLWYHLLIPKVWRLGTYLTPITLSVNKSEVCCVVFWQVLEAQNVVENTSHVHRHHWHACAELFLWYSAVDVNYLLNYYYFLIISIINDICTEQGACSVHIGIIFGRFEEGIVGEQGTTRNFRLLEICQKIFLSENCAPKMQNWAWKPLFWWNLWAKLKFWALVISSVWNLQCF